MKTIFEKISITIISLGVLLIIGYGVYQFISSPNLAKADVPITKRGRITVIGTESVSGGVVSTSSAKLVGNYASYKFEADLFGQIDLGFSFTPYESGTTLRYTLFQGVKAQDSDVCSGTNISWYKLGIDTIGSSTNTKQTFLNIFFKDEGVAFVASTTYPFYDSRDWSSDCYRIDIKENGVSSSYGDIFVEAVKSN